MQRVTASAGGLAGIPRPLKTRLPFVLLPLVFFVVAPALLVKQNLADLGDLDPRALLVLPLLSAGGTLALHALRFILSALPRRGVLDPVRGFEVAVDFGLFFVVITTFILPLAQPSGMVEPWRVPVDYTHAILAFSMAAVLTHLASSAAARKPLLEAVVFFVSANALATIPAMLSLKTARDPAIPAMPGLSNARNILVLSFDGISGTVAREVLAENPDLAAKFKGFTIFDRVASSSPATSASIASSLFGNRDFKAQFPSATSIASAAPDRLLTNRLGAHGYRVATYGVYNEGFLDPAGTHTRLTPRDPPSVLNLLDYATARTLSSHFVARSGPLVPVDRAITRTLSPLDAADSELMTRFANSRAPSWKSPLTPTLLDFREYVGTLHVGSTVPVAHFLHFTHTHFPVEFDRSCQFHGDEAEWFQSRQNRNGVKEETYCSITQFAAFLDHVRAVGAYDRSLIVLKSDHGTPVTYNDPATIESFRIRGDPNWGLGRYRPFLAIKGFDAPPLDPAHDDNPVLLDDLARTLCEHSGTDLDCGPHGGFDLVKRDFSGIEANKVTLFVVRGGRSEFRYEAHEAISFPRGTDIVTNLHRALSEEVLRADLPCGGDVRLNTGRALDNGNYDGEHWLSWRDGRTAHLRFRLARRCPAVDLILASAGGVRAQDVAVRVNGAILRASAARPDGDDAIRVDLSEGLVAASRDIVVDAEFLDAARSTPPEILGLHLGLSPALSSGVAGPSPSDIHGPARYSYRSASSGSI